MGMYQQPPEPWVLHVVAPLNGEVKLLASLPYFHRPERSAIFICPRCGSEIGRLVVVSEVRSKSEFSLRRRVCSLCGGDDSFVFHWDYYGTLLKEHDGNLPRDLLIYELTAAVTAKSFEYVQLSQYGEKHDTAN